MKPSKWGILNNLYYLIIIKFKNHWTNFNNVLFLLDLSTNKLKSSGSFRGQNKYCQKEAI